MADDSDEPTADTPRERLREITVKLTKSKVLPTFFITEAIRSVTYHVLAGTPDAQTTAASLVLAVGGTGAWVYTTDEVGEAVDAVVENVEEAEIDDDTEGDK